MLRVKSNMKRIRGLLLLSALALAVAGGTGSLESIRQRAERRWRNGGGDQDGPPYEAMTSPIPAPEGVAPDTDQP